MTSSLVGSEMCIRDRQSVPRLAVQRSRARQALARIHNKEIQTCTGFPRACLLYTSDAADDM
eukprot:9561109-Prorocentrum_lima.AAC.1